MIYKSVSIKDVIGRVLRGTRVQDSSYINDMSEWIPEAMGYMRTKHSLRMLYKDVDIEFFKGRLPCCLQSILAVSYKCKRLRHYNGFRPAGSSPCCPSDMVFVSDPTTARTVTTTGSGGTNITQCDYEWTIPTDDSEPLYYFTKFRNSSIPASIVGILAYFDTTDTAGSITSLEASMNAIGYGTYVVTWDNTGKNIIINTSSNSSGLDEILVQTDSVPEGTLYDSVANCWVVSGDAGDTRVDVPFIPATSIGIATVMAQDQCDLTYYEELDYINTSFECGTVRIFYTALPLDDDGFPLIPDNEEYKQAIYWYVRGMMIGAGYKDTVFKYDDCEARFEKHAARAVSQIRYPSVDMVETSSEHTRLVMPQNYFETFFDNLGHEGIIG